jgi:heavy metal sensor kinase
MLTIKAKIILADTIVFGALLCVFAYYIYQNTREAETERIDAKLEHYAAELSTELGEEENALFTPRDAGRILKGELDRFPGLRAQLIGQNGELIVGDSMLAAYPIRGWNDVLAKGPAAAMCSLFGREYRYLLAPVEIGDVYKSVLELAVPTTDIEERLQRLRLQFFLGIPLALAIAAFAAYSITRMAFRPMAGMVATARQISANNLHRRLSLPAARDEVRLLGETLNRMMERIDAAFRSQKQFIADASHEIRTPLTVICNELEFAEKRTSEPPVQESIQASIAEIDRLMKLTDGLLLLAKLDASQLTLNLESIRLDELLVECVQLIGTVARKKNIQLQVHLRDAVEIQADREKMKRVIVNLLDNAVKYSPEDTIVTSSVSRRESRPDSCMLRIGDQGPGIPESSLPHIFTRFYRVDPARTESPGIGLGLAIVKHLVELHGGTITVQSEMGRGTMFTVELPATGNF